VPERDGFLARIEPSAIGSAFVLLALIAGLGYGAWSVLNEVQRVQVAPSENTPDVLTDLDPLDGATRPKPEDVANAEASGVFSPPGRGAGPALSSAGARRARHGCPRDAPISTLDPARIGTYASDLRPGGETSDSLVDDALRRAVAETETGTEEVTPFTPRVVEAAAPGVSVFAVRPAWIRIRAANGLDHLREDPRRRRKLRPAADRGCAGPARGHGRLALLPGQR
jgi:cytoskeleton protein RodZ